MCPLHPAFCPLLLQKAVAIEEDDFEGHDELLRNLVALGAHAVLVRVLERFQPMVITDPRGKSLANGIISLLTELLVWV